MERIFLVLREKVALRRIHALDANGNAGASSSAGGSGDAGMPDEVPAGGPPPPDVGDTASRQRGEKRPASDGPVDDQSKRPAL